MLDKHYPWSYSIVLYTLSILGDWGTSFIGNFVPGIYESNPLTRDVNLHFVLHKAITLDTIFFALLCIVAWSSNWVLKYFNKVRLGEFISSGIFAYFGTYRILDAVLPNIRLILSHL